MKHVFIINPTTKSDNVKEKIELYLQNNADIDGEIYLTKKRLDATEFVKNYIKNNPNEKIKFYACGGDGTLNEVANGIYGAENAVLAVYPCGNGNDFIKCVGEKEDFLDLNKNTGGVEKKIDLIKVNNKYCINVCNFGLDAIACKKANELKDKKKNDPYTKGTLYALFNGRKNKCKIYADGKIINENGEYLLCTAANGEYIGGAYKCAPNYDVSDGLMEVCMIKIVSIPRFLMLVGKYKKGLHLQDERFKDIINYTRAKKLHLVADEPFDICLDGEMYFDKEFDIEIIPSAITLSLPLEK